MTPLFSRGSKLLVGVVHLLPLPGAPRYREPMDAVVERAVADARAYARGGAGALLLENFGDIPFASGAVPPETVAAMAVVGAAVRGAVNLPVGFNVLRNDARAALGLCAACGGRFVRVNVHTGAMVTDQGVIEGHAHSTLRERKRLCPAVQIFADVQVKHAVPLGAMPLEIAAVDTLERGLADALIVSGVGTSQPADPRDVERVRAACPRAKILIGSGVTPENAHQYVGWADGVIAGSSLKHDGQPANPVDPRRVAALARALGG